MQLFILLKVDLADDPETQLIIALIPYFYPVFSYLVRILVTKGSSGQVTLSDIS